MSKPVVYEHFGGKEGLYAVVVDREVRTLLDGIRGSLGSGHQRELLEQAALALLDYIEDHTDGFRILARDSSLAHAGGSFATILNDVASQVEGILSAEFKRQGLEPEARARSTPRCSSAWWPSPASGGWTPSSPGSARWRPTW